MAIFLTNRKTGITHIDYFRLSNKKSMTYCGSSIITTYANAYAFSTRFLLNNKNLFICNKCIDVYEKCLNREAKITNHTMDTATYRIQSGIEPRSVEKFYNELWYQSQRIKGQIGRQSKYYEKTTKRKPVKSTKV